MKRSFRAILLSALAGCGLAGCNNNPGPLERLFRPKAGQENRFTILLMTLRGKDHVSLAKHFEGRTKEYTGWKDVFVVHKAKHSLLFWGKYKSIEQAGPNLKKAKGFRSKDTGLKPFGQAITVPLPGRQPGPPEWNIERLPAKYCYTVLVADFFDVPAERYVGRKQFAVDYCKQLRNERWEAYYHHGASHSAVMVGKFDKSVVRVVQRPGKAPRKEIIGKEVLAIQRHKGFRFLAVNGRKLVKGVRDPRNPGKLIGAPEKCRVIVIPGRKAPVAPPRRRRPLVLPGTRERPRIFP